MMKAIKQILQDYKNGKRLRETIEKDALNLDYPPTVRMFINYRNKNYVIKRWS